MPAAQVHQETFFLTTSRFDGIIGGAAGNHTVTGIKVGDVLKAVLDLTDGVDLTSEFTISATDTINNTGGTVTTADLILVVWDSVPAAAL